jgi:predicted glycoside hydrolase/deacetylase ChbG (UPF0249 family)
MSISPRVERWISALATIAALVVLPLYAVKVHLKVDYTDFLVYHRAAIRVLGEMWALVYNLGDGTSPFRYVPITLPFFSLFGHFDLPTAQLIWYFVQYAAFAGGLYLIYRTLLAVDPKRAKVATLITFFFILRFCLDTFTIGQVSSLMFLGYCIGLYGFVSERYFLSGSGLFIPTVFKIGPGISYLLFLFARTHEKVRAWLAPVLWTAALTLITLIAYGGHAFRSLFEGWVFIVSKDDQYYDASHYGSQSLKSVLLRLVHSGFLSMTQESWILLSTSVIGCLALLLFWRVRKPTDARARGIFFSLGIFPYLWFMPETFKYSLTTLALPIAFLLLSRKPNRLTQFSLALMFFGVSAAAKDIMPDALFFGLQRASVPFIATIFLCAALIREALLDSRTSAEVPNYAMGPWKNLPPSETCEFSVITPIGAFLAPQWDSGEGEYGDEKNPYFVLDSIREKLDQKFGKNWEWIGVFAPALDPREAKAIQTTADQIQKRIPNARFISSESTGRGAALREGFLQASGKALYLMRWEQPVDVEFLEEGLELLNPQNLGYQIVRGNRRLNESRFEIPVKHLNVAYSRHRLGLLFNRLVRFFLPAIQTTDTHSGHILLTRAAASQIFAVQTSPDFLFDLELDLTAQAFKYRMTELPVRLYLFEEKSSGRILAEVLAILTGLPRLASRYRRGCYHPLLISQAITADDWGISPAVNRGILELARAGTIRRVSLMANCAYLTEGLEDLKKVPGIQLGLHFNLTYGKPLHAEYVPVSPGRFTVRWLLNRKKIRPLVRAELQKQLERIRELGIQLDYLDGHHHIQITPGLFAELSDLIKAAGISTIRLPYDPGLKFSGKLPLLIFSKMMEAKVKASGFRTLKVFYPQLIHFQDHGLLRSKINENPDAEVIVHPAYQNDMDTLEYPDSYTDGRVREYHALKMITFLLATSSTPNSTV